MAGYYHNAEATAAAIGADGFLDTGDMGYWLDGEIVITGRAKDLILHNGRNIWPQDIEWAAEQIEPLRSGDVAAFAVEGEDGDDEVVVLVQCRLHDRAAIEALRHEVAAVVHRSAGVECKVVMVPPKSLPFTSSGKLSRAGAKQKFLSGEIAESRPCRGAAGGPSRGRALTASAFSSAWPRSMSRIVAITGATGFAGRHAVAELAAPRPPAAGAGAQPRSAPGFPKPSRLVQGDLAECRA